MFPNRTHLSSRVRAVVMLLLIAVKILQILLWMGLRQSRFLVHLANLQVQANVPPDLRGRFLVFAGAENLQTLAWQWMDYIEKSVAHAEYFFHVGGKMVMFVSPRHYFCACFPLITWLHSCLLRWLLASRTFVRCRSLCSLYWLVTLLTYFIFFQLVFEVE